MLDKIYLYLISESLSNLKEHLLTSGVTCLPEPPLPRLPLSLLTLPHILFVHPHRAAWCLPYDRTRFRDCTWDRLISLDLMHVKVFLSTNWSEEKVDFFLHLFNIREITGKLGRWVESCNLISAS